MKKVLVFGMTANPGGMESVVMNYYRHIDRSKLQFDFLCYNNEPAYADEIRSMGGKISVVPGRHNYFAHQSAMKHFFDQYGKSYDAIWENANSLTDIEPLILAKQCGIPVRIMHSHNAANMDHSRLLDFLHRKNLKRLDRYATDYWACSLTAAKWCFTEPMMHSSHFRIIPNAIDTQRFSFDEKARTEVRDSLHALDKVVYGTVGRLQYQKNQFFLLDIFERIHQRQPQAEVWMIGDGPDREKLIQRIDELNLRESVRMLGVRSDVARLYNGMDIFLLPSRFEGLPVVLLEAQCNGLPCVVSNTITQEVALLDTIRFVSLEDCADQWADVILNMSKERMKNSQLIVGQKGYDIAQQAKKLQDFFL